jgi:hypothetical protein
MENRLQFCFMFLVMKGTILHLALCMDTKFSRLLSKNRNLERKSGWVYTDLDCDLDRFHYFNDAQGQGLIILVCINCGRM